MTESGFRVLVAMDTAAVQEQVFALLTHVVGTTVTEIAGLYVEDTELLAVARLPVSREVSFLSGTTAALDEATLERQLRGRASRLLQLFEAAARRVPARTTSRIARGPWLAEVRKALPGHDLLVLGHSRRPESQGQLLRRGLTELLADGPPRLLLVQERWPTGSRVAVLYDGTAAAGRALDLAASLARGDDLPLTVLLPATSPAQAEQLATEVQTRLPSGRLRLLGVPGTHAPELARAAAREDARVLCLPVADPVTTGSQLASLLERVSCSLVAVR